VAQVPAAVQPGLALQALARLLAAELPERPQLAARVPAQEREPAQVLPARAPLPG
jgi:hypothetical protein